MTERTNNQISMELSAQHQKDEIEKRYSIEPGGLAILAAVALLALNWLLVQFPGLYEWLRGL